MVTFSHEPADKADADLERRVRNYLVGRQMPGLRHIEVEANDGIVTLRGVVRSFYEKQLCIHCCRRVAGVMELVDEVAVVTPQRVHVAEKL